MFTLHQTGFTSEFTTKCNKNKNLTADQNCRWLKSFSSEDFVSAAWREASPAPPLSFVPAQTILKKQKSIV
jgi:hypothetical protein